MKWLLNKILSKIFIGKQVKIHDKTYVCILELKWRAQIGKTVCVRCCFDPGFNKSGKENRWLPFKPKWFVTVMNSNYKE